MPRKSRKLPSDLTAPQEPLLREVPALIADKGRVAGFTHLRDRLLGDFEIFVQRGVNPYSTLKLIIEMDRHAMFAEVQERKVQGQFDTKIWEEFQDYLHGEPNADPPPTGDAPELPEIEPLGDLDEEDDSES